jgi:hypothetical protein
MRCDLRKTETSFGNSKIAQQHPRSKMAPTIVRYPSVYRIGDMVSVDPRTRPERPNSDGGIAYILEIKKIKRETDENDDIPSLVDERMFNVRYPVVNRTSRYVEESRLKPTTFQTTSRKRPGQVTAPSLLSTSQTNRHEDLVGRIRATKETTTTTQRQPKTTVSKLLRKVLQSNALGRPRRETCFLSRSGV